MVLAPQLRGPMAVAQPAPLEPALHASPLRLLDPLAHRSRTARSRRPPCPRVAAPAAPRASAPLGPTGLPTRHPAHAPSH
jgi:hypothetical protein